MTGDWEGLGIGKYDSGCKGTSVLAPLSGELPKAEGAALAVYFGMNIASVLGDIHLSGYSFLQKRF